MNLRHFFAIILLRTRRCFLTFLAIGMVLCTSSCDTVNSYIDDGLTLIGLGEETPELPKKPPTTRRRGQPPQKTTPKATPGNMNPPTNPAKNDTDIIIKKTENQPARKVEKKDLKSAQKPEFRVEAPVDVQKRVGGAARLILSDEDFIYLDFPQHFAVYDNELNFLARLPIAFPLKEIRKFKANDKTYLYLKEENDVLEILELSRNAGEQGDSWILSDVISYEVGGKFIWVDGKTLLILLKDKLQFLDFNKFSDVKIINEVPIRDVSSALSLGKYLYLSRKGFLDILDNENFKTLSSTRIGRPFDFLGVSLNDQETQLVLSLPDEKQNLTGVQFLSVTNDYSGITDFGSILTLDKPLRRFFFDAERKLILGQEVDPENAASPVQLYDLGEKRFLRGELTTKTDLLAWSMNSGKIHIVTPLNISVNALTLSPDVIEKAPLLAKVEQKKTAQPPLAQIGAAKTLKDEYSLTPEKNIEFMADARKAVLLDDNHFIVFENRALRNFHQIYASENFADENFTMSEPTTPLQTTYTKVIGTDFGMMTYVPSLKKIFFLGVDLKEMVQLPVEPETLISWSNFTSPEGEVLVLSSKHERGTNKATSKPVAAKPSAKKPEKETVVGLGVPPPKDPPTPVLTDGDYVVRLYLLKSPQEAELLAEIFFDEKALAIPSMENELAIILEKEIRFYGLENMRKPIFNDPDKLELPEKRDFVSIKPYLIKNRVFSLIRENDRLKVLAFTLTQPNEQVILEDFDLAPEQFDGASFSKGGQLFILPTSEGTLFYDLTELHDMPEDKRIVAHWDLPSEWVDVAKGGRFICVALGAKGVYCGDLLFY